MPTTTFPATNEDGQSADVTINADPAAGTAHVTSTDGQDGTLTGVTVSDDGKSIKGDAKIGPFKGPATITIDCDAEPPTITIIVKDPAFGWATLKTIVYTITHQTQDKLIKWIKGLRRGGGGSGGGGGPGGVRKKAKRHRLTRRRPPRRHRRRVVRRRRRRGRAAR